MKRFVCLVLPALLAACGTLPQPFYGDPGKVGAKLAVPPAPVLIIPPPTAAMLDDQSALLFSNDLATALVNNDIPSIAKPAGKQDWRLTVSASVSGNNVIPAYVITGPDGKSYGTQTGAPVSAAAWANGDPAVLSAAAAADAPALTKQLTAVNAQIQGNNPNSLENRVPRIFLTGVTGAPGDGDTSLALNMRRDLPGPNLELTTDQARADFTVTGIVKTSPDAHGQILVELDWNIFDSTQRKIGQVTQLHDLNPADITPYWGDVAAAAAQEAAAGVQEAVGNAVLHKPPAKPAASALPPPQS